MPIRSRGRAWRGPSARHPRRHERPDRPRGSSYDSSQPAVCGPCWPSATLSVVSRLKAAGAVILGKTNLHEFAFGGSGIVSAYGPACNPWDSTRITGGSSSGSAAAVATGMCIAAIGTDTAGSVRIPAALCGIVGHRPSAGVLSNSGIIPLRPSFDAVGPMTRTVQDAWLMLQALSAEVAQAEIEETIKWSQGRRCARWFLRRLRCRRVGLRRASDRRYSVAGRKSCKT